jgi:RND family efflux transporter MFP subunit
MHPAYRSDKPGVAPDCGMELQPVYAGTLPAGPKEENPAAPSALKISSGQQQSAGVQVSKVERTSAVHTLRLFGRVVADETRVYRLIAGLDGFIREASSVTTGSQVKKNEWLATYSSPEMIRPIQAFFTTLETLERQKRMPSPTPSQLAGAASSVDIAIDRLLNVGMSHVQIEEIQRTRIDPLDIKIVAPADGLVLARNVTTGQRFDRGAEWYRIASLDRVWIVADVYPKDSKYVRPGQAARIALAGGGAVMKATVSEVLPQFDPASRTLKVRLESRNPGYVLRPEMFVDVELPITMPSAIVVPVDAVLDSGTKRVVFVETRNGTFEPREIETGWRSGESVEIVRGLDPGERIVTAGNFLLDSESRMKRLQPASHGSLMKDPSCGMMLDPSKTRYTTDDGSERHYFCSEQCKREFEKHRAKKLEAGSSQGGPLS